MINQEHVGSVVVVQIEDGNVLEGKILKITDSTFTINDHEFGIVEHSIADIDDLTTLIPALSKRARKHYERGILNFEEAVQVSEREFNE